MSHRHADHHIAPTDASGAPVQSRRFTRHEVRATAKLEPLDENLQLGDPLQVSLQNIGRTGAMFDSPEPLQPGSTWRLTFTRQGHRVGSVPLAVRYSQPAGAAYHIGAQFIIEPFVLHTLGVRISDDEDVDMSWDVSALFEPPTAA